jgi:hypothetical protein
MRYAHNLEELPRRVIIHVYARQSGANNMVFA